MLDDRLARQLVREFNKIEGIDRAPYEAEISELKRFTSLEEVTVKELERFVYVFQPGGMLRNRPGVNVMIANHLPLAGGPQVETELRLLLGEIRDGRLDPFQAHCEYEHLHPFTDGNGRSGRALWTWHMIKTGQEHRLIIGFLHNFYYQTLSQFHKKV